MKLYESAMAPNPRRVRGRLFASVGEGPSEERRRLGRTDGALVEVDRISKEIGHPME